jgi:hypothetical protein
MHLRFMRYLWTVEVVATPWHGALVSPERRSGGGEQLPSQCRSRWITLQPFLGCPPGLS